jgi:hypothetical protein
VSGKETDFLVKKKGLHETSWQPGYRHMPGLIRRFGLKRGVEVGVAFGGHAEAMLSTTKLELLYGVDPYRHHEDYKDPMNFPQEEFDRLYSDTLARLGRFGKRYQHLRLPSAEAALQVAEGSLDFVYIDADHSYNGVWNDINRWADRIRVGGFICGHDFDHPNHPGVGRAVKEFFSRLNWPVTHEGDGVWWARKLPLGVSVILPCFNAAADLEASLASLFDGNLAPGDEIVAVDDGSKDASLALLRKLARRHKSLRVLRHPRRRGAAAAGNSAVKAARNELIFCLYPGNRLEKGTLQTLRRFLLEHPADAAAFGRVSHFRDTPDRISQEWIYRPGPLSLSDCLAGAVVPPSDGNYLFTKHSWVRAGGYPEAAGALDAWGFGLRQVAAGCRLITLPGTHYLRLSRPGSSGGAGIPDGTKAQALPLMNPLEGRLTPESREFLRHAGDGTAWFEDLARRPLRVEGEARGRSGWVLPWEPAWRRSLPDWLMRRRA